MLGVVAGSWSGECGRVCSWVGVAWLGWLLRSGCFLWDCVVCLFCVCLDWVAGFSDYWFFVRLMVFCSVMSRTVWSVLVVGGSCGLSVLFIWSSSVMFCSMMGSCSHSKVMRFCVLVGLGVCCVRWWRSWGVMLCFCSWVRCLSRLLRSWVISCWFGLVCCVFSRNWRVVVMYSCLSCSRCFGCCAMV